MKNTFLLIVYFFSISFAFSQGSSYQEAIAQGDTAVRKGEFQVAINKYFAAEAFDPSKKDIVKAKINDVFTRIENLRKEAETAKENAQAERNRAQQTLAQLRQKNEAIFTSFADLSIELIYTLEHEEALEKMAVAVDIEVDETLKKQTLQAPIEELLFFFAEGDRRPELARQAAELLLKVPVSAELQRGLKTCLREKWTDRDQFTFLLKMLRNYEAFQNRYYPQFVSVPLGDDGTFEMGSSESEEGHGYWEAIHQVKLSPYQIMINEVTFYQFSLFSEARGIGMDSRTPYWGKYGDHPVVNVAWYDAVEYANWLNEQLGMQPCYTLLKEKNSDPNNEDQFDYLKWKVTWDTSVPGYRLPTEAEWELAARGGVRSNKTLYAGSNSLDSVAWFWENSGDNLLRGEWDLNQAYDNNGRTHPTRRKLPNQIGVYDMSGNVNEWVWDWFGYNYFQDCGKQGVVFNPRGAESSSNGRVIRGGSWASSAQICRSAFRYFYFPDTRNHNLGFRLVFVPQ